MERCNPRQMAATWEVRLIFFILFYIVPCFAIGMVRLVDPNGKESISSEGRVEFFFNGKWGGICFNDFMEADGGVLCRHLKFPGLKNFHFDEEHKYTEHHDVEVACYGHEADLHYCDYTSVYEWGDYDCKKLALYISCYNNTDFSPVDRKPSIRLAGGNGSYGKVEVLSRGSWQTVCGEDWEELEGGVVCRELGFRGVVSVTHDKESPVTSRSRFKCNGYELSLQNCSTYEELDGLSYSGFEFSEFEDEISCPVSVDVTCLRDMEFLIPKSKHTYERRIGENLTLTCNVTNSTETWWEHKTWSNQTLVGNGSVLHLRNISVKDQGSYVCVAKGSRGQIVESEATQTLIISDYVQLLLHVTTEISDNISEIGTFYSEKCRNLKYDVDIQIWDERNCTLLLGRSLTKNTTYATIIKQIDDIVDEREVRRIKWRESLSFCIGEENNVPEVGILNFPSTKINSKAESIETCLTSDTSRASRECVGDLVTAAVWQDADLRNCFNTTENSTASTQQLVEKFFQRVDEDNVTSENVTYISRDLADLTAIEEATEQGIDNVTIILGKITNVGSTSPTVTRNVIETVDNVVVQVSEGDNILPAQTSSTIIASFEQQLNAAKRSGSNFSHKRSNIAVEVAQIEGTGLPVKFEYFRNDSHAETKVNRNVSAPEQEKDLQASVEIPSDVLKDLSENCTLENSSSLPVSFTIFLNGALFNDSQTQKERNSLIVSTSMLCEVSQLPNGTSISTHFSPTPKNTGDKPWQCVYWDQNLYSNENGTGGWSPEGCIECGNDTRQTEEDTCSNTERPTFNLTTYKCSWTHLTNFAVLLDVKGDSGKKALDIISKIGCIISIVSLLITIISHLFIKKLRSSQPKQIIIMLCAALSGLYWCFLVGIERKKNDTVCVIFGVLIHFFCLSSLSWMSIEATQLYLLLVKVINAHVRNFMIKASVIAWGIPLVVVVVCVAADWKAYVHNYCFPVHCSYVFYIGVLGLAALLLAYNIVMYIMIVRNVSTSRKNINTSQSNRAGMIRRLQNALAISVLLGLSWVFGFLAIGNARVVFNVLFCLFNSFQGFFIFLLFCLRQEEIRQAWRDWLRISICVERADDAYTVSDKPSASTSKQLTSESDVVSKSVSKVTEKSETVELLNFKRTTSTIS